MEQKNKAWVARDPNGAIFIYQYLPIQKIDTLIFIPIKGKAFRLPDAFCPNITHANSPQEIILSDEIWPKTR